jgi:Flp pilus assembly protein TadD
VATALTVLPLYVANTAVVNAQGRAPGSAAALDDLDRAAWLNPWAVEPLILESTLRGAAGDTAGALRAADEAVQRSPGDWTAWVVAAESRLLAGDRAAAAQAVNRLEELNPRAPQLVPLRAELG